jgi:hypothetical protein
MRYNMDNQNDTINALDEEIVAIINSYSGSNLSIYAVAGLLEYIKLRLLIPDEEEEDDKPWLQ